MVGNQAAPLGYQPGSARFAWSVESGVEICVERRLSLPCPLPTAVSWGRFSGSADSGRGERGGGAQRERGAQRKSGAEGGAEKAARTGEVGVERAAHCRERERCGERAALSGRRRESGPPVRGPAGNRPRRMGETGGVGSWYPDFLGRCRFFKGE